PIYSNGAYAFIGHATDYDLVAVDDNDNAPAVSNSSPFSATQTAEPNDSQAPLGGGAATGTVGVCVGGCNNTWGSPTANLSALNLIGSVAEESITGVNFGYNIPSAIIYGNIWWDVDADATRDAT